MVDMGMPAGPDGQAQDPAAAQAAGYEICIRVTDAGISVYQEPIEAMDEEGEPQGQPANGIGEALKLALQMYQQSSAGTSEDQVQAGFAQAS